MRKMRVNSFTETSRKAKAKKALLLAIKLGGLVKLFSLFIACILVLMQAFILIGGKDPAHALANSLVSLALYLTMKESKH